MSHKNVFLLLSEIIKQQCKVKEEQCRVNSKTELKRFHLCETFTSDSVPRPLKLGRRVRSRVKVQLKSSEDVSAPKHPIRDSVSIKRAFKNSPVLTNFPKMSHRGIKMLPFSVYFTFLAPALKIPDFMTL